MTVQLLLTSGELSSFSISLTASTSHVWLLYKSITNRCLFFNSFGTDTKIFMDSRNHQNTLSSTWTVAQLWHFSLFSKCPKKAPLQDPGCIFDYSGLSLSRLLPISNFSLFRTKSSISWTFVYSLSYFYLFISNFSISKKNLGPLRLFLSLSRTFSRLRVHLHSK